MAKKPVNRTRTSGGQSANPAAAKARRKPVVRGDSVAEVAVAEPGLVAGNGDASPSQHDTCALIAEHVQRFNEAHTDTPAMRVEGNLLEALCGPRPARKSVEDVRAQVRMEAMKVVKQRVEELQNEATTAAVANPGRSKNAQVQAWSLKNAESEIDGFLQTVDADQLLRLACASYNSAIRGQESDKSTLFHETYASAFSALVMRAIHSVSLGAQRAFEVVGKQAFAGKLPVESALSQSLTQPEASGFSEQELLKALASTGDSNSAKIYQIATDPNLTGDEKLREIICIDRRFASKSSAAWAQLVGGTDANIRQTPVWRELRKAAKASRL